MKRLGLLLALLTTLPGAACDDSTTNSLVVVTVTAAPSMPAVSQLRVRASNASSTQTKLFPESSHGMPIVFDSSSNTSLALTLPKSRSGELQILIEALDASSNPVAVGSNKVDIVVGGRADVTISLVMGSTGDGGAPDAWVGDARAGRPDAGGTGGAGGIPGTGGASGIGGVIGGTGGVIGPGGVSGSGGVSSSGGIATSTGARVGTGGMVGPGGVVGRGGVTGGGGTVSTGGGSGTSTRPGSEPCSPAKEITSNNTGNFGTKSALCFRTKSTISGWGCSNLDGRTIKVNNVIVNCGAMPLPAKVNGYYYFDVSAGSYEYASIYWYALRIDAGP